MVYLSKQMYAKFQRQIIKRVSMRKFIVLILIVVLLGITGCQHPNKKEMLEIYENNETYITLEGEIVELHCTNSTNFILIKCEELKQYISNEEDICMYQIFSEQDMELSVGDVILFTTSKVRFDNTNWLPIVAITKNDVIILEFEDGKKNLIDWVKQLQKK